MALITDEEYKAFRTDETVPRNIETLTWLRLPSTKHMGKFDRENGTMQMIDDLNRLASEHGCIAAAWALEVIECLLNVTGDMNGRM